MVNCQLIKIKILRKGIILNHTIIINYYLVSHNNICYQNLLWKLIQVFDHNKHDYYYTIAFGGARTNVYLGPFNLNL